ncbi:MAG: T9SS type A sorting domain-containing protein [Brumimicrobium sp.]
MKKLLLIFNLVFCSLLIFSQSNTLVYHKQNRAYPNPVLLSNNSFNAITAKWYHVGWVEEDNMYYVIEELNITDNTYQPPINYFTELSAIALSKQTLIVGSLVTHQPNQIEITRLKVSNVTVPELRIYNFNANTYWVPYGGSVNISYQNTPSDIGYLNERILISNAGEHKWDALDIQGNTFTLKNLTKNTDLRISLFNDNITAISNIITIEVGGDPLNVGEIRNKSVPSGHFGVACYNDLAPLLGFTTNPSGATGYYSYQWQISDTENGTYTDLLNYTAKDFQYTIPLTSIKYFRCKVSSGSVSKYTNTIKINVHPPLVSGVITTGQSICSNTQPNQINSVTLPSGGSGIFNYYWQNSTDNSNWSNITNANSTNYKPTGNLNSIKYYRRKTTDNLGCGTIYSNSHKITIYADVSSGSISGTQTICYNTKPSEFVNTTSPSGGNGTFTYKWQYSINNNSWTDIAGATSASLVYSSNLKVTTYFRRVAITNCDTGYSNTIKVTVYKERIAGTIGENQNICPDGYGERIVNKTLPSGGNNSFTYSWESSNTGSGNWNKINYETDNYYNPNQVKNIKYFRRVETDLCATTNSNMVYVKEADLVTGGSIQGEQDLCFGSNPNKLENVTLPSGGVGEFNFSWFNSLDNASWNLIDNANSKDYTPPSNATISTYYKRVSTNTCGVSESNIILVKVNPELVSGVIGENQTIYPNTKPNKLNSIQPASGGKGTFNYLWQYKVGNNDWVDINIGVFEFFQPDNLTETTTYRRSVKDNCTQIYSNEIVITVSNVMFGGTIGADQEICFNTKPRSITNIVSPSGGTSHIYTYQWEKSETGTGDWYVIKNEVSKDFTPPVLDKTTYYRRTVLNGAFSVHSNTVEIVVANQMRGGTIGDNISIYGNKDIIPIVFYELPSGGYENKEYTIQSSLNGVSWNDVFITTENPSDIMYYPNIMNGTTLFRIKSYCNICGVSLSNTISYSIIPKLTPCGIGNNQTIDYNTQPQEIKTIYSATGGLTPYYYQWQSKPKDTEIWNNIIVATNFDYQPPTLTSSQDYRVIVSDHFYDTLASNVVSIIVNPDLIAGTIGENQRICYNTAPETLLNIKNATGGTGTYNYNFQVSKDGINWTDISNSISSSFKPSALLENTLFRRKVTSGTITKYSNTVLINVDNVINKPAITGTGIFCANQNASLNIVNSIPNYTYQWIINSKDTLMGTSIFLKDLEKNYILNVAALNDINCKSDFLIDTVVVDPIKADFTFNPSFINCGDKVDFYSKSKNAVKWEWNLGLAESYTTENPAVYFNVPNSYNINLTVTSVNNCISSKTLENAITVYGTTSIVSDAINSIRIFPNPSHSTFKVDLSNAPKFDRIRVVALNGVIVLDIPKTLFYGVISLPNSGTYIVQFILNSEIISNAKIIKL